MHLKIILARLILMRAKYKTGQSIYECSERTVFNSRV